MAGTGPTDLQNLAQELLAASIEALDTIPTYAPGLAGSPERTYVSPGQPAFDCCDQLTTHAQQVVETPAQPGGLAAGTRHRSARKNLVQLVVTATRCIDISNEPPSPEELGANEEQIDADGWALWNHIWNLIRAGLLFTMCGEVFWRGMTSITPSGGCGGWKLTLDVELEGYEEALST